VVLATRLAGVAVAQVPVTGAALVEPVAWDEYFPFRLGDSWTYDWQTQGPLAVPGIAVRTRSFDGTSFVSDSIGYKLVSDDGTYHLYTLDAGRLTVHSSLEHGRYFDYEPPVVVAAPDLRVGQPRVADQKDGRRWTTTLLGLRTVTVPMGTFDRVIAVQLEMSGPDYVSAATHYFARRVGLIAYDYTLRAPDGKPLLVVHAQLRLARLGGVNVTTAADLAGVSVRADIPKEDRSLRDRLRSALTRRYVWDAGFPGLRGDVALHESGKPPVNGSFAIGPDLSVTVEAADAGARGALRHEISSFVTHRKPMDFDLTYADTTFVTRATRPDGAVVIVAANDPLATTYTIRDGDVLEMGRSMGRVSYLARERSRLSTDDGRAITIEYDVLYTSNETGETLSTERTRESYVRLGRYWVPESRLVDVATSGGPSAVRSLVLSNLRLP
jgi:hypothetical protein